MTAAASSYRVSLRLYVVFSLLMAVSAAASGLLLLYLARPFIAALGTQGAQATALLFTGAGIAGALAAVAGLLVGLSFAGRIRGIVQKAEALSPRLDGTPADGHRRARRARRRGGTAHAVDGSVRAGQRHPRPIARGHAAGPVPGRPRVVQRDGRDLARPSRSSAFAACRSWRPRACFPLERGNSISAWSSRNRPASCAHRRARWR